MRALALLVAGLLGAVLVAGCFEGKADFTFNPDGTGKVVGEITFPLDQPWEAAKPVVGDDVRTFDQKMKEVVATFIKKSTGIEAWKDVSFEAVPGDRVHFRGTAYFKEAWKVKFYPDIKPRVGFAAEGTDAMKLILQTLPEKSDGPVATRRALSTKELEAAVKTEREGYRGKIRSLIDAQLNGMKFVMTFTMPGRVGEVMSLNKDGALTAVIDGTGILKSMDALVADNAYMKELVLSGGNLNMKVFQEQFTQKLYGPKGEAWAMVNAPLKARFDYKVEADAAKKAMPDMMAELGLEAAKTTSKSGTTSKTTTATTTTTKKASDTGSLKYIPSVPDTPATVPTPLVP
jgi:hypothetical protein